MGTGLYSQRTHSVMKEAHKQAGDHSASGKYVTPRLEGNTEEHHLTQPEMIFLETNLMNEPRNSHPSQLVSAFRSNNV